MGGRGVTGARAGLALAAVLGGLTGCATTHVAPIALEGPPAMQAKKDPAFAPAGYVTFSVFPVSRVNGAAALKDPDAEKALLFSLRNDFEALGYRFVKLGESPDLLVTFDASVSPGHAGLPKAMLPPDLAPHQLVPPEAAGVIGPAARGALAAERYGEPTAAENPWASIPEYPPRGPLGKKLPPTYTFVSVTVSVLEAATLNEVWTGAAAGVSRSPDAAVCAQAPLWDLVHLFPGCPSPEILTGAGDVPGLRLAILTNDGKNWFPTLVALDRSSPAWQNGLKNWDMLLSVDGSPVANLTYADARARLAGAVDAPLTALAWRNSEQIVSQFTRLRRDPAAAPIPAPAVLDVPASRMDKHTLIPVCGGIALVTLVTFAVISTNK